MQALNKFACLQTPLRDDPLRTPLEFINTCKMASSVRPGRDSIIRKQIYFNFILLLFVNMKGWSLVQTLYSLPLVVGMLEKLNLCICNLC